MNHNVIIKFCLITLITWVFGSCSSEQKNSGSANESLFGYTNVLDLTKQPENIKDYLASSFSDLGAWHSYSLPSSVPGGFTGPFLMTDDNGFWLSLTSIARLTLQDADSGVDIPLTNVSNLETFYLPGKLMQRYTADGINIHLTLLFVSNRASLIEVVLNNIGNDSRNIRMVWNGSIDEPTARATVDNGMLTIKFKDSNKTVTIIDKSEIESVIENEGKKWRLANSKIVNLEPNENYTASQIHAVCYSNEERNTEIESAKNIFKKGTALAENFNRWAEYIDDVTNDGMDSTQKMVAVKSLVTLVNNWRSPAGELKYEGLFPSYAYEWFHGFWSWDSWKHAVALVKFNPELAKNQIRSMYYFQDDMGMIADCVYRDTFIEAHNWRNTKPPLSAWAVTAIFQQTKDTAFVAEMFPKMMKYHEWWYKYRDHDQDGLCEYGSTDGTRVAAAWESGMDNAVRFDSAIMIQNNDFSWSLNQESVDLNAYLYAEKKYLSTLSKVVIEKDLSEEYSKTAELLKEKINEVFYDEEEGYYYDVYYDSHKKIKVQGPEGWIPLWAEVADEPQARRVVEKIMDGNKFNTLVPFPTLAADHEKFNPEKGYWRGPVWFDQVYFALSGMRSYGFEKEAIQLQKKLFDNAEGLTIKGVPLRENYHPVTGKGLNAVHFSWTAAHILMLLNEN